MDVSRLLAVVNDVELEYRDGISQLLKALIDQYTVARDTPAQDNTPAIQNALQLLVDYTHQSVFVNYSPSKTGVLEAIGGFPCVGEGLESRLKGILAVAGQTTAGIVTGLTQLQSDLEVFRKACIQIKAGLKALGISPHMIPKGEFEVGVLIPEQLVDQKLGALAKELEGWNKIVRGFQEAAGEEEREVTISGLASGSYEFYLPLGVVAAGLLSRTIDKVLEWYLKILEIRKRRLELQELGAPVAEVTLIKEHERDVLDKGIRTLVEDLVRELHPKIDETRKNELETHLTLSVRQIARFVDKGGTVEVDSTPPEEPGTPPSPPEGDSPTPEATQEYERLKEDFARLSSEFEKVSNILDSGRALRRLPGRQDPILQLNDGEPGERAESDKTAK